jgi:hypothetical protein
MTSPRSAAAMTEPGRGFGDGAMQHEVVAGARLP